MERLAKILSFVKTLRIEPYLFIHMFAGSVASVTTGLLQQDKICINVYGQSSDFCENLNDIKSSDDPLGYKDKILGFATQMGLYSTLLDSIPSIIWSLFIGSFTDKFLNGRKIVMCLSSLCGITQSLLNILNAYYFHWSPYYLLLTTVPTILTGGGFGSIMAIYSYVSINSKKEMRSIRYAMLEFAFFLGSPLGTYIGGLILKGTPNSSGGQLHNYITIIGVSLLFQVISFVLLLLLINEKRDRPPVDTDTQTLVGNEETDTNANQVPTPSYKREESTISTLSADSQTQRKWYYPITLIFDIKNVKEVWVCGVKKRSNSGRLHIWLLFMAMCVMLFTVMGSMKFSFQFSEKVYYWSATFYSDVHSVSSIVGSVLMTLSVPLFVLKLKLKDTHLAIVGFLAHIFRSIAVGSYQHPIGYYISVVIGSVGGLTSIAIRSKLSKLVGKHELGKVFSLLSTLESITPLVSSLVFTFLFEWSLGFFPGLVFEVCAAILIIPLLALIYIDLIIESKDTSIQHIETIAT